MVDNAKVGLAAVLVLAGCLVAVSGNAGSFIPMGGGSFQGGTVTTAITYSATSPDVLTPSGEDFTLYAQGAGADIQWRVGDSTIEYLDGSDGVTVRCQMQWSESGGIGWFTCGTGATGYYSSGAPFLGATTNVSSSSAAGCFGDTLTGLNTGTATFCSYGAGLYGPTQSDAQTCANNSTPASAGTLTVSPASSYVSITLADPDGCTLTIGETSPVSRSVVDIVHAGYSGSGAGAITASAVAGVYDNGGVPCVLNDGGVLGLTYSIANAYSQRFCAAN